MDTAYNPFREAGAVAIAELTSNRAQRFYSLKAQQDTQEAIEATLVVLRAVYLIARFAYDCGYLAGECYHTALAAITAANRPKPLTLPGTLPMALLSPPKTQLRRLPSRVGPTGEALVTKPAAEALDGLTVRQLRGLLQRAGLRPVSGARKAELRAMLG